MAAIAKERGAQVEAYYREQWAGYDLDADGVISMRENLEVDKKQAEDAGAVFEEAAARSSFALTDANQDGVVDQSEFLAFMLRLEEEQLEQTHELCRQQFGAGAEFDGVESCVCKQGFDLQILNEATGEARCVPVGGQREDVQGGKPRGLGAGGGALNLDKGLGIDSAGAGGGGGGGSPGLGKL